MKNPQTPYRQNPLLRLSYSLIAPLYDAVIERPMRTARKQSLSALPNDERKNVLVSGAGTGLDLPLLPTLHLITAVVPQPELCLREAARVLKVGGTIILFDKFLQLQQTAWLRRALTPISRRIATRMDVVFEEVLSAVPDLEVVSDVSLMGGGWFHGIVLRKTELM